MTSRPCAAGCGRVIPDTAYRSRKTCSTRCRKALSRKNRATKESD